ncbi:unnamed protein product [Anisakis simplex]|uniref:Uncharacterized protein n=1 Tax=Anisakis simplex TaxID=6269 RepID=A0A0M3JLW2_ANISI|nr:unnamed protein product [Anisakis simplex]
MDDCGSESATATTTMALDDSDIAIAARSRRKEATMAYGDGDISIAARSSHLEATKCSRKQRTSSKRIESNMLKDVKEAVYHRRSEAERAVEATIDSWTNVMRRRPTGS